MKTFKSVLTLFFITLIISSCSTSDKVVTGKLIQKRKYTKGYHLSNRNNNDKSESKKKNKDTSSGKTYSARQVAKVKEMSIPNDSREKVADYSLISDKQESIDNINKNRSSNAGINSIEKSEQSIIKIKNRLSKKISKLSRNDTDETETTKVSGFAIASLLFSLIGLIFFGQLFGGAIAVLFGIIALIRISNSDGKILGSGIAMAGLILGLLELILAAIFLGVYSIR